MSCDFHSTTLKTRSRSLSAMSYYFSTFLIREYSQRLVCLIYGNMCLAEFPVPYGLRCLPTIMSPAMSCHTLHFQERVWRWMFSHMGLGKHLMAGQRLSTYSLPLHAFLLSYYLDLVTCFLTFFSLIYANLAFCSREPLSCIMLSLSNV